MLKDATILVTGGTGSFGSEFVRTVLQESDAKRIIVLSRDELKQHDMRQRIPDPRLSFFIGDVRDKSRLYRAFKANVDIVVHTAALKHVPICEYNPFEAIRTNILGAQNVIEAAIDCGVTKIIALSTDKATNPTNLYGATKLCAEKLFVQGNSYAGSTPTRFSCVRYGNVLGSRGSVLPVFLEQRKTGRITVTDKRMTRFWITLRQGVRFVLRCIDLMQGGEVFIPQIPSTDIMTLVKVLAPDCEVEVIGIRPGEKLHEVLVSIDEARHTVSLDGMYAILPEHHWWGESRLANSEPVPEGFAYASDTNPEWLSVETLREFLDAT